MAFKPNPLRRRLALVAGGAVLLAGGAGAAYATSLGGSPTSIESGYATVVDGGTTPGEVASERDCPDRNGGPGSQAPDGSGESGASNTPAEPSAPGGGDV